MPPAITQSEWRVLVGMDVDSGVIVVRMIRVYTVFVVTVTAVVAAAVTAGVQLRWNKARVDRRSAGYGNRRR